MTGWDESRVTHGFAELGEVRLHYVESGDGPLVVLLHGFPEFWYSWRNQILTLAEAGFRVVAPDMRGYNLSSKPRGVAPYRAERLVADVEALVRFCGAESAALAGHDWGGGVAWATAMLHPERVERLAILNAPHPVRFAQGLRTLRQLRKSWYVLFFQLPSLPEYAGRAMDFRWGRWALRHDPVRRDAFTDEDVARYVEAWSRPGCATATINYYRAAVRRSPPAARVLMRPVGCPVLVIWGERDRYLGSELADPPRKWVPTARVERISDASHWVQCDRPERVNELLLEFLAPLAQRG